jgi:hypothetical protein
VPSRNQATTKYGSERANADPQVFAYGNGAVGRASGRPSTSWTSANWGWISALTKALLERLPGSTSSSADFSSTWERNTPARPPTVVTTNIHERIAASRPNGSSAGVRFAIHSRATVQARYIAKP